MTLSDGFVPNACPWCGGTVYVRYKSKRGVRGKCCSVECHRIMPLEILKLGPKSIGEDDKIIKTGEDVWAGI